LIAICQESVFPTKISCLSYHRFKEESTNHSHLYIPIQLEALACEAKLLVLCGVFFCHLSASFLRKYVQYMRRKRYTSLSKNTCPKPAPSSIISHRFKHG
jgi:hypothetical protein